jgi:hypothetical protein
VGASGAHVIGPEGAHGEGRQRSFPINLAYIDSDFTTPHPSDNFDTAYMNAFFNHAYEKARHGYPWQKTPPLLAGRGK